MTSITDETQWSERDWKLYNAGLAEGIARAAR